MNVDKWRLIPRAGSLIKSLSDEEYWQSAELLKRVHPLLPTPELQELNTAILANAKNPRDPAAGLGKLALPLELLEIILELIEGPSDIACLCGCNKTLWAIGYKYLVKASQAYPNNWQGDRILCLGDRSDDLPEGLLAPEEQKELEKLERKYHFRPTGRILTFMCQRAIPRSPPGNHWTVRPDEFDVYDGRWILCNSSKRQYVRADTVREIAGDAVNLGDVLLSQICWSSCPDIGISGYEGDVHRGLWAGDRFLITTLDELKDDQLEHEGIWQDMSGDVMQKVLEIWRRIHGPDWPETAPSN